MTARKNGNYGYQVENVPERKENWKEWSKISSFGHLLKQPLLTKNRTGSVVRKTKASRDKVQMKGVIGEILL